MDKLIAALRELDPQNDEHWTADGLPRVDVVEGLAGVSVTRAELTNVAKTFSRANPVLEGGNAPTKEVEPPKEDAGTVEGGEVGEGEGEGQGPEEGSREAAEQEVEQATLAFHAAQKRLKEANEALDVFVRAESAAVNSQSLTNTVQQFLASQKKQQVKQELERQQVNRVLAQLKQPEQPK